MELHTQGTVAQAQKAWCAAGWECCACLLCFLAVGLASADADGTCKGLYIQVRVERTTGKLCVSGSGQAVFQHAQEMVRALGQPVKAIAQSQ